MFAKRKSMLALTIVTCVIVQLLLVACTKKPEIQAESSIEKIQKEEIQKEEIVLDKYTIHEKKKMSSVHMECNDYSGSGIIWEISDKEIVLMSNRHLMERGNTVDVSFASGVYYPAKVVFLSDDYDFALAEINKDEMDKEDLELLDAVSYESYSEEDMVVGETLFIISSKEYPADSVLESSLVETASYVETDMLYTSQYMMLGKLIGTETLSVEAGMSGSGVFNSKGDFVGIVAGGDGNKEYMMVPIWNILTGLKN